jgi:hypothetical protein
MDWSGSSECDSVTAACCRLFVRFDRLVPLHSPLHNQPESTRFNPVWPCSTIRKSLKGHVAVHACQI